MDVGMANHKVDREALCIRLLMLQYERVESC